MSADQAERPGRWLAPDGVLNPVLIVAALGLVAVLGGGLERAGVPSPHAQQVAATAFLLFAGASILFSPQNGLVLLLLLPPLFNGEDYQAYFFLLDVVVYLTLLAWGVAWLRQRQGAAFPYASVFGLFLLSTMISCPLDLRGMWLAWHIADWPEVVESIWGGDPWSNFWYIRTVLDLASGVGLFVVAVNQRWTRDGLVRLALAATVLYATVVALGLGWERLFSPRLFLTLRLADGVYAFSGIGFNQSYFAQYALAYLPLVVLVVVERTSAWARVLAGGTMLLASYAILITYQRGAWAVFAVESVVLMAVIETLQRWPTWARRAAVGVVSGLAAAWVALLVFTPIGGRVATRLSELWQSGDPYRQEVLAVAWRMFGDYWLLGIGTGGYAHMFPDYSAQADQFRWGWLSSHNLFAQFLAEQGIVGLLSFLAVVGVTLGPIVRARRRLGEERGVVLLLLVSVGSWLSYGLLQYTFLLRAMQIYFWITLGVLVALTPRCTVPLRVPRVLGLVLVAVLALAAGLRAQAAMSRPLEPGLLVGFHAPGPVEPVPLRWTRGEAAITVKVEGPIVRVPISCPIPEVTTRPQTVTVLLDERPVRQVTIDTLEWRWVEVPLERPVGSTVVLGFRSGYTFVPAWLGINDDTRRLGVLVGPVTWPSW